jgi:transcriptional repressor NrdR
MTCPVCGGQTRITDSRAQPDVVRRRRECLECGYRFTTKELEVDVLERLTDRKSTN